MALASIDRFLFARRNKNYDCLDFAAEVWEAITAEDIRDRLGSLLNRNLRSVGSVRTNFKRLSEPEEPCFVVFHSDRNDAHVGVFLRGRVLHLLHSAPEFMELDVAGRGFTRVRFFR